MPRFNSAVLGRSIIALLLVVLAGLSYVHFAHPKIALGAGDYQWVTTFPESGIDGPENFYETWAPCHGSNTCSFTCNAGTVGQQCTSQNCTGTGGGDEAYVYAHAYTCENLSPPPSCTPDSSCAANTCSTNTCTGTDASCNATVVAGTKNCSVPCTATNSCGMSNSGTIVNGSCSAVAPSNALCPAQCVPYSGQYCAASNSCGMVGWGQYTCGGGCTASAPPDSSCTVPPPPPSCTPNDCAANTCSTTSCVDSCGSSVHGTKSCTVTPPDGGGGTGGPGGPGSCTNPAVGITASPNRVQAGDTTTLTVSGTGLNGACVVTGGGMTPQTLTPASCNLGTATIPTPPITTQTTFTVTCASDGTTASTVIVNINPVFQPF